MGQDRDIKYTGRDFTNLRNQLVEYAKNYFPNTYNDFSPTSPGMMFIEMAAYVGDVLSFYQDLQLQETYLQYAKDPANLYSMAYMMGYRPKVTTSSEVLLDVTQTVDAVGGLPNWSQALQIGAGTQLSATTAGQPKFYIDKPIDFTFSSSYDPTLTIIQDLDNLGEPLSFTLVKQVKAYSGEVKTKTETIVEVEKFKTITLDDTNIIGIISVVDSQNNIWYEVPFLGQDTILVDEQNISEDSNRVKYNLSLQRVSRRFVTRFTSTGQLQIQFGAGITGQEDEIITPDPTNIGLGQVNPVTRLTYAYDPSNFLHTQTYGLAPSTTVLTITYLVGGGIQSNVPANTVNTVVSLGATIGDTSTLVFNNPQPASGGRDGDTVEELRQNALRSFNEQGRAVTLQDYTIRALSLPAKYGSIGKVYITQDQLLNTNNVGDNIIDSNPLSLSMYVLAYDNNKSLITASKTLKDNLKKYLSEYMLLTDAINIKDAFVVNIEVEFDIIIRPNFLGRDVLLECTNVLKDFFNITKWNINQPINLSTIYTQLDRVKGVQTVQRVEIKNKQGGNYSQYAYDTVGATRNNIVYPSYDPMIFEVKFPDTDIKGRIVTF
jgi:hypothetical protein